MIPFGGEDRPSDEVASRCVHCGLCLPVCPTYRETGQEMSSPRGRIYLIRAVSEGRLGLDSALFQEQMAECLNCRACEAACPSGVRYGELVEASRAQLLRARSAEPPLPAGEAAPLSPQPLSARLGRWLAFAVLFGPALRLRPLRLLVRAIDLYQRSGLQALLRHSGLLRLLGLDGPDRMLPPLPPRAFVPAGQRYAAEPGPRRRTVALFTGCVMSAAFAPVHEATVRVLRRSGCDVLVPPGQGCCGALPVHSGDLERGRELARRAVASFDLDAVDAIVINAAGCGSQLKEVGHLLEGDPAWRERARAFAAKVRDVHELLDEVGLDAAALGPLPLSVTYQDACHLAHAQGVSAAPRRLLRAIPGLRLVEMAESALCCGSAGVYNLTQPEMAARLGARKADNLLSTGAAVVATGNPGCAMQLRGELSRRQAPVEVCFVVELLDRAYAAGARGPADPGSRP